MRMKLKKKCFFRGKFLLFFISFIICLVFILFSYISSRISNYYLNYSYTYAKSIMFDKISNAFSEDLLFFLRDTSLYDISYDKNGNIQMIDFDSYTINKLIFDISSSLNKYVSINSVYSFSIPSGAFFSSPFLNEKGPLIPVKIRVMSDAVNTLESKTSSYGINSSLVEVFIKSVVKCRLILGNNKKDIVLVNEFPISYKIISGKVPTYYNGKN